MIVVRVKQSLRGELVLPTVGYAVKANCKLSLSRNQFYANDIQAALRSGMIEMEDDSAKEQWSPIRHFKVKNVSGKALTVAESLAFLVGEAKFLNETSYLDAGVQSALRAGWLESEELADVEVRKDTYRSRERKRENQRKYEEEQTSATEASPDPKHRPKKKAKPKKAARKPRSKPKPGPKTQQNEGGYRPEEPLTTMQSWNASEQKAVPRDESNQMVAPRIEGHEPEYREEAEVQVGEIDFSDIKPKSASKKGKVAKGKAAKKGKGRKGLRAVGRRRAESRPGGELSLLDVPLPNESSAVDGFVDTEQLSTQMSRHPDNRISENNSEVE